MTENEDCMLIGPIIVVKISHFYNKLHKWKRIKSLGSVQLTVVTRSHA